MQARAASLPRPIILVVAALMAVAVSYAIVALRPLTQTPTTPAQPLIEVPAAVDTAGEAGAQAELERIGGAISTWSANLERDPADFISAVNLSSLYLARANLTAASDDYDRALRAADQALETDPALAAARLLRARVLFASHDFAAAEQVAQDLLADEPSQPAALAILGDARLELGDYTGATDAYDAISGEASAPLLAREARLAALTGHLDRARAIADSAAAMAADDPDARAADRSFYRLLEGALAFQAGDLAASVTNYRAAVEAFPGSPQALAGLGRAQAAGGNLDAAIDALERAVAIRPEPETLALLGDVLTLAGREAEAETRYDQVRGIAAIEREAGLFNRSIVLFLADHGESPDEAVALAKAELTTRTDVHGWDAYAWALFAAERFEEADAAIAEARAKATEDAVLDYHAGMIAAALGRAGEARELLQGALDRGLTPLQAERARQTLAELGARP